MLVCSLLTTKHTESEVGGQFTLCSVDAGKCSNFNIRIENPTQILRKSSDLTSFTYEQPVRNWYTRSSTNTEDVRLKYLKMSNFN